MSRIGHPRGSGARAWIAFVALTLFVAAQCAALGHTHGVDARSAACAHGGAHDHGHGDVAGTDPAGSQDSGPDGCALCRVSASAPAPLALPAPLPLPETVHEPLPARAAEPARPPVVRDSLARGPPCAGDATSPRVRSRAL